MSNKKKILKILIIMIFAISVILLLCLSYVYFLNFDSFHYNHVKMSILNFFNTPIRTNENIIWAIPASIIDIAIIFITVLSFKKINNTLYKYFNSRSLPYVLLDFSIIIILITLMIHFNLFFDSTLHALLSIGLISIIGSILVSATLDVDELIKA